VQFSEVTRTWLRAGRHIEIDGRRIFVVNQGLDRKQGETLLLLHGFPTSCHDWRLVMAELTERCACVAFDFIGFGLSDKPIAFSYSLFQQADMLESLCSQLGLASVHLVSHDMGTSVHTELLARAREQRLGFRIKTSTFLNGSMIKDMAVLTSFQRILEPPSRLPEAMEMCNAMVPIYIDGLKRLMIHPEALTDDDVTVMTELLEYQQGNRRIPGIYSYVRERYLHMDRWLGALEQTTDPVQLIWASGDPVAVESMGDALAARLPRARHIKLADAGHFLPVEAPDAVAGYLGSFIDEGS
jgi:pimeloyl-ACP methyl ester carboxylesterase